LPTRRQPHSRTADAEANRIRVTAAADSNDEIRSVGLEVKSMLIQKIVAERLSDKLQIMMVPNRMEEFFSQLT